MTFVWITLAIIGIRFLAALAEVAVNGVEEEVPPASEEAKALAYVRLLRAARNPEYAEKLEAELLSEIEEAYGK